MISRGNVGARSGVHRVFHQQHFVVIVLPTQSRRKANFAKRLRQLIYRPRMRLKLLRLPEHAIYMYGIHHIPPDAKTVLLALRLFNIHIILLKIDRLRDSHRPRGLPLQPCVLRLGVRAALPGVERDEGRRLLQGAVLVPIDHAPHDVARHRFVHASRFFVASVAR